MALLAVGLSLCFHGSTNVAHAQDKPSAKVAGLLEASGYAYTKAADGVWAISFKGKSLPSFNVVASVQPEILVLFTIVVEKKELKLTPEAMQRLLKLNSDLDRVKIGIDKEGDLFVRVDLSTRLLDAREMKENVEQVAAATDEVFAAMRPFIGESK
jgi:hypothetical protein